MGRRAFAHRGAIGIVQCQSPKLFDYCLLSSVCGRINIGHEETDRVDLMIRALVAATLLASSVGAVEAGITVRTSCQKNLSDGRILVEDYTALPSENSTYKVVSFRARKIDGDWAYGPCVLDATR